MFCKKCGTEFKFCGKCGNPVSGGQDSVHSSVSDARDSARSADRTTPKGFFLMWVAGAAGVIALLGILGINAVSTMNDAADDLYHRGLGGTSSAQEVVTSTLYMSRSVRNAVIMNGDEAAVKQYKRNITEIHNSMQHWLGSLRELSTLAETHQMVSETEEAATAYTKNSEAFIDFVSESKYEIPSEVIDALRKLRASEDELEENTMAILALFDNAANSISDATNMLHNESRNLLMILTAIGVAICAMLGFVINKHCDSLYRRHE